MNVSWLWCLTCYKDWKRGLFRAAWEEDELTVRAGGAASSLVCFQGCEPRPFCQLAQPSSHDRKSAFKHGGPTPTENMYTHHARSRPCEEFIEMTALIYIPELRQSQQSALFPPKHHLRQKTELGSALLEAWSECLSCWNLHEDNSVQMCEILRFTAYKLPPDSGRHSDNTGGIHWVQLQQHK